MDNRRVTLTKRILKETLIEELKENPLSQVTIKELCEKADLNRSTFYAHYEDVYELFNEIEDDFLTHIVFFTPSMNQQEKLFRITKCALYVQKNKDTFFALIENGHLLTKFMNLARRHNDQNNGSDQNMNLLTAYTVTGTIALLHEWLENPAPHSPEEIAKLILALSNYAERLT